MRLRVAIAFASALASVAACGGGENSYRVPASSPMKPFVAPDRDDLVDDDGEDLEAGADDTAAPAAAPVAAPAPAPVATQPKPPAK